MGISHFDKDFIKLAEKMGVKDEQSKILLRDLVSTYLYAKDLKDIGGIKWVVETLISVINTLVTLNTLHDGLQEDNRGFDEDLIDSVSIPYGLKDMIFRLSVIIEHLVPAMENAGYVQRQIWDMKLTVINGD